MSPVTPKPAAEFSTFAMTKSMSRCSISAGIALRAISRPGLPKMSPTKRIRTLFGPHRNAALASAPLFDAGKDDAQLAVPERGRAASDIERARQPHAAREAAEAALRDVESSLAVVLASQRHLLPHHDERIARDHDLHAIRRDARKIDDDLYAFGSFENINRRCALRGGTPPLL